MSLTTYTALDGLRLGVIDDNAYFRRIVRSMLGGLGVRQVVEATTMDDGWDLVIRSRPDILLLDWNLGSSGDGAKLLDRIRTSMDESISTLTVVFVSAHSDKRHVLLAARLGANDFIVKPFAPKTLYERLRRQTQSRCTYERRSGRLVPVQFTGAFAAPPPAAPRAEPVTAGGVLYL